MAVKIRLKRLGAKKRPFYRVIVIDSRSPCSGREIAIIGTYNPMLPKGSEKRVVIDGDLLSEWIGRGAQMTDRVAWFVKKGFVELKNQAE